MVVQLPAAGVAYEAYPSLDGVEAGVVTIPFSDFRHAPWDTGNADRRITLDDLRNVSEVNVYVNQVEGGSPTGTSYLDDIRTE
jgi:mannan endo-1,4-beta-mannosidase